MANWDIVENEEQEGMSAREVVQPGDLWFTRNDFPETRNKGWFLCLEYEPEDSSRFGTDMTRYMKLWCLTTHETCSWDLEPGLLSYDEIWRDGKKIWPKEQI